jgi:signal transduction histidine kinase
MTRKRTVRRVYDLIDPIAHAAYQASRLTEAEWNRQVIPVQVAVDQLAQGNWTNEHWQSIFECLNRIESMVKLNRIKAQEWIDDAQLAMVQALDRRELTGATAFKAHELATIREILSIYGDLLKEVSHLQFANACRHTTANMTRILSNKKQMHQTGSCVFETKSARVNTDQTATN